MEQVRNLPAFARLSILSIVIERCSTVGKAVGAKQEPSGPFSIRAALARGCKEVLMRYGMNGIADTDFRSS